MRRSHQVDTKMEIVMEDQIKLDNQVAQCAPFLEQEQVGQIGQVETQSATLLPKLNITNLSEVDSEPMSGYGLKCYPKGVLSYLADHRNRVSQLLPLILPQE